MKDLFRIVTLKGFKAKYPYFVFRVCYIDKNNVPTYRLVKQCRNIESANQYIADNS